MACMLLASKTSVAMVGTATTFTVHTSMYYSFLETCIGYGRCMVSRGVRRLTGTWCGAFGDAIVCVDIYSLENVVFGTAAATFKYFMCALNGCTEIFLYMPTNIWEDQTDDE